ncbi:Scr1 family TA system antitoxin-like transcriptional regulator [Actinokineospora sp. G85]|uniref:helix-turn-helix domain-containing protein n=1 Tax=Actinokineospora sp. G85 TaxID=3406626 RepID=UPI003C75E10B
MHSRNTDYRARTLRGLLIARELDGARRARGLSTRDLAAAMTMSPAMVNRVMTGRRVPTALEIGGLCAVLKIPATRRPVLYQRVANAEVTGWVGHLDDRRSPIDEAEAVAGAITWFASTLIPRPLRTPAYDEAIGLPRWRPSPVPRSARFLLHPLCLNHPAVPRDVMRTQLLHLRHNTTHDIHLVPAATNPEPAFRLLEVKHFPPIVHIEHQDTDVLLEDEKATAAHVEFINTLRVLPTAETTAALDDLLAKPNG